MVMAAVFPLCRSRLRPSCLQFASHPSTAESFNNWKDLFGNSYNCFQYYWRYVHLSAHSPSKVQSGETDSVLEAELFKHWFKNWQDLRKTKLTASTFGLAIGFWPRRRVQLWLEKIGAREPFSRNLATCWNNLKEQEALERYKLLTGSTYTVEFPEFQVLGERNPEYNWLAASPDGVVKTSSYDLPDRGVLEIKCPFFGGDMSKASPWKRIPLYCMPQAQGLMEILDKDWMHFYVWIPGGSSLFRVERDRDYWDVLKIALSDFWWNHVQPARELCSKSVVTEPLTQLKYLKPEPKHELCSFIVHESKRAVDKSKLLAREINGIMQYD
uniref:YqaJ viral recombinase domain-containing protein n=1 Tax=Opuntia streptacantha TaxID=393608 RepID=A0A7C9AJV7_OPUST